MFRKVKPIAVVKVKSATRPEEIQYLNSILNVKLKDYRVLVISCLEEFDFLIDVYNGESISKVQFEELKQIINETTK